MDDDLKEVVERLEERVAAWSANGPSTTARINIKLTDLRALLSERRKMVEALEQIASRARSEVWPDHYAPEPPEWALDDYNEASTCGYCNAWLTVVRPGKSQCDCCADGQDLGAIARDALTRSETNAR